MTYKSNAQTPVAVIRLSAMGDAINAFACISSIHEHYPDRPICWMLNHTLYPLFAECDWIDFILIQKTTLSGRIIQGAHLVRKKWPILLHMHPSWRANLLSLRFKSKRRVGFDGARSEEGQKLFCNERIQATDNQHVVDGFLSFAMHAGVRNPKAAWPLPIKSYERNSLCPQQPYIVISPGASSSVREWDPNGYAEVMKSLDQRLGGVRFVLTATSDLHQLALCAAIESQTTRLNVDNRAGKLDLRQLAYLLKKALLLIAPDSGPIHLASALKTAAVGLYASMNPQRTGPYNSLSFVVNRYPEALELIYGKKPSDVAFGFRIHDARCMQLIKVPDVVDQCLRALNV